MKVVDVARKYKHRVRPGKVISTSYWNRDREAAAEDGGAEREGAPMVVDVPVTVDKD